MKCCAFCLAHEQLKTDSKKGRIHLWDMTKVSNSFCRSSSTFYGGTKRAQRRQTNVLPITGGRWELHWCAHAWSRGPMHCATNCPGSENPTFATSNYHSKLMYGIRYLLLCLCTGWSFKTVFYNFPSMDMKLSAVKLQFYVWHLIIFVSF